MIPPTLEDTVQPDASPIITRLSLRVPPVGFYDAPDPAPFAPIVEPSGRRPCMFSFKKDWEHGKTLHITRGTYGCGGAGRSICGVERPRDQFVKFLVDTEGLKASHELMNLWLDESTPYVMRHDHILIGPLKPDQYDCLRTVTFWVNPDQLAVLCQAAMYYTKPGDPTPVIASFGSGCMELAPIFPDLDVPQAMIGSTDIAMRDYVRPDELAFSVTRPMFELLCRWADDPRSSLHKGFLKELVKARGGKL